MLIEEVRAPGASRVDVDSLLRGLARPLGPDQSPREQADLLLSLLEDRQIADLTGSNDRTVRSAAIKALLALGYPYALEIPPEALANDSAQGQASRNLLSTPKGKWGFGLVMALGVLLVLPSLFFLAGDRSSTPLIVALTLIVGSTFLPALLTLWGHNLGNRILKGLGSLWLLVVGLLWLVPGALALIGGLVPALIPVAMAAVLLTGTWLMNSDP